MLSHGLITVARALAGFLLLTDIVGVLFYATKLSSLWLAYAALVVIALSVFCFLPRSQLRRVRWLVAGLAVATVCATIPVAYQDLTLVNGADHGALVLRAFLVAILAIMFMEARQQTPHRPKNG
jgi:hypothetical protein